MLKRGRGKRGAFLFTGGGQKGAFLLTRGGAKWGIFQHLGGAGGAFWSLGGGRLPQMPPSVRTPLVLGSPAGLGHCSYSPFRVSNAVGIVMDKIYSFTYS